MEKIYTVESAKITLSKSLPPILGIVAEGSVRTGGWENGILSPYIYVHPPEDGIQDFDFVAQPPTGIAPDVLSPISAHYSEPCDNWVQGVRIHAETNAIVERV